MAGRDMLRMGLALFLVDPVLGALWGGLAALAAGVAMPGVSPVSSSYLAWPARLLAWFSQRLAGLRSWAITSLLLTLLVAVALSAVLGPAVSGLTSVAILLAFLSLALTGSHSWLWALVRALLDVAFTWMVGYALFRPGGVALPAWTMTDPAWPVLTDWLRLHGLATLPALLFALAYYSVPRVSQGSHATAGWGLFLPAQVGVALLLVGLCQPLFAAGVLLLVIAQALFQPWLKQRDGAWFLQQTQFYVMAIMLLTALGLRWVGRLPF